MRHLHVSVKAIVTLFITLVVATQVQGGFLGSIFDVAKGALTEASKTAHDLRGRVREFLNLKDKANSIPLLNNIIEFKKNMLAGYPLGVVSSAVNILCSSPLITKMIKSRVSPDLNKMHLQLRTTCHTYSYPLLHANQIWRSPEFDPSKKVVIFVTGWTTTAENSDPIDVLAKAYNCRDDVHFLALNIANFIDSLYTRAALSTTEIGKNLGEGIDLLIQVVPLENIHLIGHGLGAHIVGAAGRFFNRKTGKLVPRITGLDPAKPCFNEGHELSGLQRGDAKFIDVIHSNPGVLGKRESIGDADFFPGGLQPLPRGCFDVLCAHNRAWEYYAESVYPGNELNFMAKRSCITRMNFADNKCPGAEFPMGYAVSHELRGNYFLEVNEAAPFGMGAAMRSQTSCGLCTNKRNND